MHLQLPNWSDYLVRGVEPRRSGDGQPLAAPAAEQATATRARHDREPASPTKAPADRRHTSPADPARALVERIHAGDLRVPCLYCHFGAERSRHAGIPPVSGEHRLLFRNRVPGCFYPAGCFAPLLPSRWTARASRRSGVGILTRRGAA